VSRYALQETVRLTDITVRKLLASECGSKGYGDDSLPDFAVHVRNTSDRTFILTPGTEIKRITLGRYGSLPWLKPGGIQGAIDGRRPPATQ
jgi:hypothetical protein